MKLKDLKTALEIIQSEISGEIDVYTNYKKIIFETYDSKEQGEALLDRLKVEFPDYTIEWYYYDIEEIGTIVIRKGIRRKV